MRYELLAINIPDKKIEKQNVALILRGTNYKEYAVVRNLDVHKDMLNDDCWDWTIDYWIAGVMGFQKAIECYRSNTEENYIPRCRLEELATVFKDRMVENCDIYDIDETIREHDLNEHELEFFELQQYVIDDDLL